MKKLYKNIRQAQIIFNNSFLSEWKSVKNDKAVVSSFFMIAFVILAVYTYIYSNEVVTEIPTAIVDQDASQTSRTYINMLQSNSNLVTKNQFANFENAKKAYFKKEVMGLVLIPSNFENNIKQGKQTTIIAFADASNMIFYKNVLATVTQISSYFNAGIAIKKEMLKGSSLHSAKQNYNPIRSVSRSLFNTNSGYATYIMPIFISLVVQLIILLGVGILNGTRKENNKLHQNFYGVQKKGGTIPALFAKATLYILLFALILPLQIAIVHLLFNIPIRTSLISVLIFTLPYLSSVVFLGITIS
ncbi:MAG TPA: ABC transporter permease, partial [Flavobacteriaceae bacterium]|nr:ABC transporter permease [Flavobacteriaceae bacterium]